jgi:hypothetical protein
MSSAGQYKVDLDALDQVMVKLNGVLKGMQETKGRAAHSTYLAQGVLGTGFEEEQELRTAHNTMKSFFEDEILKKLEELIDDLSRKTRLTRGAYEDQEHNNSAAMNAGAPGDLS